MAGVAKVSNFPRLFEYCTLLNAKGKNCCDDDVHSSLVVVVECRKLESVKGRGSSYSETLRIYVADHSCQLFPITFYGQDAVKFVSTLYPGDIIIVEDFKVVRKTAYDGKLFSSGISGERTRTYRAFSSLKADYSFHRQQYPDLYEKVKSLIRWANDRYPFMYR